MTTPTGTPHPARPAPKPDPWVTARADLERPWHAAYHLTSEVARHVDGLPAAGGKAGEEAREAGHRAHRKLEEARQAVVDYGAALFRATPQEHQDEIHRRNEERARKRIPGQTTAAAEYRDDK